VRPDRTRSRGGFSSKSDAADFLDERVKEVSALRRGDLPAIRRRDMPTLRQLVDEYLAQYSHEANSEKTARYSLKRALDKWGEIPVNRIASTEVRAWRRSLPERSAWQYHKTLRAVLNYAVATKLLDENPAAAVPNPRTKPREVQAFESWEQIEAVAEELGDQYGAIPLFVAATGLRPEEWVALERRDVDRQAGVVHVRRVYTDSR
jgi:integrase